MATYVYDDFRLTFTARDDGSFDVLAADADGGIAVGVFSLPLTEAELEQAVLDVATARAAARRTRKATPVPEAPPPTTATITRDVGGAGPPPVDAERLGRLIAEALFNGEIGTAYESARRAPRRAIMACASAWRSPRAPALLSVPWEFLYRPPRFLASQRRSPLVRVLERVALASPPTVERSVRVLGVVASPRDLPPLDVAAEREPHGAGARAGARRSVVWSSSGWSRPRRVGCAGTPRRHVPRRALRRPQRLHRAR